VQTASYLYLTYWRILIWPMIGLGPVHEINARQFALIDANSLLRDALALLILAWGLRATWKRAPIGALICGFTLALVPTLHIIPVAFDDSLYHERYAMLAIAITCAWLPKVIEVATLNTSHMRAITLVGGLVGTAWLGLATANIRVTLPLWSDEVRLWQWVLRDNPNSMRAKDHLLSTYLERSDLVRAQALADEFIADNSACPNCLLNAANLALLQQDSERAELALKKTKDALARSSDSRSLQSFILATGQLRELQNNPTGAEDAYRDAIKVEPTDPLAHMNLALLLARQGQTPEAREAFAEAEALFAPEERGQRREEFERTVVASRPASNSSSQ